MKHLKMCTFCNRCIAFLTLLFVQTFAFAQQGDAGGSKVTTTTHTTTTWYAQPWVWIVAAAIFILLLVALVRGGSGTSRTDRVTVTKTSSD